MTATITYADGGPSLCVSLVYTWDRATIPAPASGSSGMKDLIRNDVWRILDAHPEVDRVVLVRGHGAPFFLMHTTDGRWFDVSGKQVVQRQQPSQVDVSEEVLHGDLPVREPAPPGR